MRSPTDASPSLQRAPAGGPARLPRTTLLVLATALALGAAFRNAWPLDMEWKADEQLMVRFTEEVGRTSPWPWTGMGSGVGTPNPGMSVWVFVALARLGGAATPVELGRAVMLVNTLALLLLAAFALTRPAAEREPWAWATALVAVSPHQVQLHRKIWAQSVVALPFVGMVWGWWNRGTAAGSFAWGALGACLGQIHMSGFFLQAALALTTVLAERAADRRTRWGFFAAGSLAGGWPLVPWGLRVLGERGAAPEVRPAELLRLGFWQHWLNELLGLQPEFSLGRWFWTFLGEPRVGGYPTGAVLGAYVVLSLAFLYALAAGVASLRREGGWRRRLLAGPSSRQLVTSALVVYGVLITLPAIRFHPHYMAVLVVVPYLWLARCALGWPRGRAVLGATLACYAIVTTCFLSFVHQRGGAPNAEYGVSYRAQMAPPR
jgi:hypothetical protein